MLVQLTVDQISTYWELLKSGIAKSLPPIADDGEYRLEVLLESLLMGRLKCWIACDPPTPETEVVVYGAVLTSSEVDLCSGIRSLNLYSVFGYKQIPKHIWQDGFATLSKYAKANGCQQIVAFTSLPSILALAEQMGADTSYRLIKFTL